MLRDMPAFHQWAHRAVEHIRFPGDRPAVRQELLEHMEDRFEALLHEGVPEREALRQTLAAMGDPDETGRELAKIHKPWLGWLYKGAKWLLAASAVLALMTSCVSGFDMPILGFDEPFYALAMESTEDYERAITLLYPEDTDSCCGYTFSLPVAMHRRSRDLREPEDEQYCSLSFVLEAFCPMPGAGYPDGLRSSIYAVDSLGNLYPNRDHQAPDDPEKKEVCGNRNGRTAFRYQYEMWIADLDPAAEWVELRYARLDGDFSLRIPLPEGDGAA